MKGYELEKRANILPVRWEEDEMGKEKRKGARVPKYADKIDHMLEHQVRHSASNDTTAAVPREVLMVGIKAYLCCTLQT